MPCASGGGWLPQTVVAMEADEVDIPLHLPAESLGDAVKIALRHEDGATAEFHFTASELPQTGSIDMDGRTWVQVRARLPIKLAAGYHELDVQCGAAASSIRYIAAPARAWSHPQLARGGRTAGIAIALYGLRSARNWGCGDFRDLWSAIDWAVDDLRASFIGLNPLHAIHNRRPYNTSPYLPNCIFYQNFLYLDIEGIEQYARCGRAQRLRASPAVEREIEELRAADFVEYERLAALKLRFLWLLYAQFLRESKKDAGRRQEFDAFRQREGGLLRRFATYCELDRHLHKTDPNIWLWTQWPAPLQDPDSPETKAFVQEHERQVMFFEWMQWQIDRQLRAAQQRARERGLSIGLYHDLALATDSFGSDLWAHRPFYVSRAAAWARRPDDSSRRRGRIGAFRTPQRAAASARTGTGCCAESIRKNCRHGGRPAHGSRDAPVPPLLDSRWLRCHSGRLCAGNVRRFRARAGARKLAQPRDHRGRRLGHRGTGRSRNPRAFRHPELSAFLLREERTRRVPRRPRVSNPGAGLFHHVHDQLPTPRRGFWTGGDIEARRRAGVIDEAAWQEQWDLRNKEKQKMLDRLFAQGLLRADLPRAAADYPEWTGELHHASIGFLALTPSQILAVNQEDITKETAQQNLPGTTWQYPNWGRKMRFTVEELRENEEAKSFAAMVRDWISNSGRANQQS